jgi:hypothetical protein
LGIFDFLRKSSPPPAGSAGGSGGPPPLDRKVAGHAKVVADKRAQTYDRLEAIQALAAMKTVDAARALLPRFKFQIDPSITDQEEKDLAYEGIVAAGQEAVPAVRDFCLRAESLTWPLKILRELLDDQEFKDEALELLERFDTEYARNVEPKVQTIIALEDVPGDEPTREAVERFLEDVNETVRFHAIQTTFVHESKASVPALARLMATEESVRVKNKVAEGLAERGWVVPEDQRAAMKQALRDTEDFTLGADGKVVRR